VFFLQSANAPELLLEHVRALAPGLTIGGAAHEAQHASTFEDDATERVWLARDGYALLPLAAPDTALRAAIIGAIGRLIEDGLPAVFIYLVDEVWEIGERLRDRVSRMLGRTYLLNEDGWAWQVAPGERGWSAHRDDGELCDREAPERVNAWVALTDVTAERACMHVVPLDDDPSYPEKLQTKEIPFHAVRALPVSAGTCIVWNANVLHWGGACARRAPGPRVAISYTLVRDDAHEHFRKDALTGPRLAPLERVDVVASLIASYEGKAPTDVRPEVFAWAAATRALRAVVRETATRR
jgi:hypothetical protein